MIELYGKTDYASKRCWLTDVGSFESTGSLFVQVVVRHIANIRLDKDLTQESDIVSLIELFI